MAYGAETITTVTEVTTALVNVDFAGGDMNDRGYAEGQVAILLRCTRVAGLAPYQVATLKPTAVVGVFEATNFPVAFLGEHTNLAGAVVTAVAI